MKYKLIAAFMVITFIVGCQKEEVTITTAPKLTYSEVTFEKNTPVKILTEEITENEEEYKEEPTSPAQEPFTLPPLPEGIATITNPSDVLVHVNKTNVLPSDYIPKNLVAPNIPFYFTEDLPKRYLREDAARAIETLFEYAYDNDIALIGVSGYRSYKTQVDIFTRNVKTHGFERANQFSAYPGQSEHQTGLTLDVSTRQLNYRLTAGFGSTIEGRWLAENAHKHGFIISYPRGKEHITGYTYEPWHIRYVGIDVATHIYRNEWTLGEYLTAKKEGRLNTETIIEEAPTEEQETEVIDDTEEQTEEVEETESIDEHQIEEDEEENLNEE